MKSNIPEFPITFFFFYKKGGRQVLSLFPVSPRNLSQSFDTTALVDFRQVSLSVLTFFEMSESNSSDKSLELLPAIYSR